MGSTQGSLRVRERSHSRGSLVWLQEGASAGTEGLDRVKDVECHSDGI